jgi:hypothetical protein
MNPQTRQPMNFDASMPRLQSQQSAARVPRAPPTPVKPDPKETAQEPGEVRPKPGTTPPSRPAESAST